MKPVRAQISAFRENAICTQNNFEWNRPFALGQKGSQSCKICAEFCCTRGVMGSMFKTMFDESRSLFSLSRGS